MLFKTLPWKKWAPKLGLLAAALTSPALSQIYTVDGSTTLTSIATQVQGKTSGVIHIRFKTYQNVGQFSVTSLSADSLIFERAEESAEAVEFTGKLFHFENVTSAVVFRNIAFRAKSGSSIFIEGVSASPNQNLFIDSCEFFGDTLNTTFLSWLGGATSKVNIQRSILSGVFGPNPQMTLTSDTVKLSNSYLNFSGQIAATVAKRIDLASLTTNRVQFRLTGDGTTVYSFKNNLFGHPPSVNRLPGNTNKFVAYLLGFAGGSAYGDSRFSTWYNYEYPANDGHADPSNITVAPFGDTTALWNFKMAGDSTNGYQNPPQAKFPAFNIFPGDTTLPLSLSSKDSLLLSFASAQIPRVITGNYGSASYPPATDSTRTFWLKDTTLQVTGAVSLQSIAFPKAQSQGMPLLFYQSGSTFMPQVSGQEGSLLFGNAQPTARVFIPVFSGQNTSKGTNISVKGITADTSFIFSTITRAGRTHFLTASLVPGNKRWRVIQRNGKPLEFKDTTNAEGSGSLQFGFGKNGTDAPFLSDSLTWWLGDNSFALKSDSAEKYWGKTSAAATNQAVLIERLAVGQGKDTVLLTQGRVMTSSVLGHQLQVDSSFHPDQTQFPDMGSFSPGVSFTWPGRTVGDSLNLELRKTASLQKAYLRQGTKAIALSSIKEDSNAVTLALGVGDTGEVIFLARKYAVPAGIKTDLAFGTDSVTGILSSKPGDVTLDTSFSLTGLDVANKRVLAIRKIKLDSLQLQNPFNLSFAAKVPLRKDSVATYSFDGSAWKPITGTLSGTRFTFPVSQSLQAIVVVEGLPVQDLIPKQPAMPAGKSITGNTLLISPKLTLDEKVSIPSYRVDLFSVDITGKITSESSNLTSVDSNVSLSLVDGRMYLYRVIYKSYADRYSLDTTWIPLPERQLSIAALQNLIPKRKATFKYLVGFPFDASYDVNVQTGFDAGKKPDQVSMSGITNGKWTSILGQANPILPRGAGYLLGATSPFQLQIGSNPLPALKADTIRFKEVGWHLFSNPFPFPLSEDNVKLDSTAVSAAWAMRRSDTTDGSLAKYNWLQSSAFNPFEGYLVYAFKNTELVFDPFIQASPSLPKSSGAPDAAQELHLSLSNGQGLSEMSFYLGGRLRRTPYMSPPSADLEMKVGEDGGWLLKSEPRLDSIQTGMEILVKESGVVSLHLNAVNTPSLPAVLIDLQSAHIYKKEEFNSIQVHSGSNSFALLYGVIVTSGVAQYLANLPTVFSLDQNYPNPFRGQTQIRYQVPGNIGRVIEERMEVTDLTGRVVQAVAIQDLTLGAHVLMMGDKGWKPGIYVYRLTLKTDQRVVSLKKKMICGWGGL